jgi:antitoxin (DNA-binding transcriptional repressor) of toxin-antitoxin stability system
VLRYLLIFALLAACGSAPRPPAAPAEPLALVGWWTEVATGQIVVIDPSRLEVRDLDATAGGPATAAGGGGARVAEGSWVGDSAGRFLVRSYGVPPGAAAPGWLGAAAGFAVDGGERVLLDRAGAPVARLVPAQAGTVTGAANPSRPPSELESRASAPAAPLPAGLRPAGDLAGRWVPVEQSGSGGAFAQFGADGTWTGSDGCTGTGGSWLAGPDGAFLATAWSVMTFVACPGVGVAPQVGAARRVGLDGSTLVLLDADGAPTGRYQRA